ncbi:MAG: STAS domain-containing protein [Alphaproteobacteria bacterium]|nr:STAS domain-containing protein [Alphaproteobacteria bacterium]
MEYKINKIPNEKIITINGNITFQDHKDFSSLDNVLDDKDVKKVTFDLANVSYIDSAAFGMFVRFHKIGLSKSIRDMTIRGAHGNVLDIMLLTKFDTLFNLENT